MAKRSEIHSEDRFIFKKNFEMSGHFSTKMLQVCRIINENVTLRSVLPKWGIITDVFGLAGKGFAAKQESFLGFTLALRFFSLTNNHPSNGAGFGQAPFQWSNFLLENFC